MQLHCGHVAATYFVYGGVWVLASRVGGATIVWRGALPGISVRFLIVLFPPTQGLIVPVAIADCVPVIVWSGGSSRWQASATTLMVGKNLQGSKKIDQY